MIASTIATRAGLAGRGPAYEWRRLWQAAASFAVLVFCVAFVPHAFARSMPYDYADLAERLLPSVVNISTTQVIPAPPRGAVPEMPQFPPGSPFEEFFKDYNERQHDQGPHKAMSLGSGFIIDPAGYIVTNNHVIEGAEEIRVILHDNTNLKAELVGRDPKTDLALLKVKADKPLTAVKWGDSDKARVGHPVLAIGNPFGLGGTVTAGIISARQRDINAGPYDDFIQTDASINRGNSGGPLFNIDGDVIGVNTAIFSPSGGNIGIGFAIPSALAQPVFGQLRKIGHTRRGWLGVRIQGVTPEIGESLGLTPPRGALIAGVTEGGPAAQAGIQAGDVVIKFDGRDVDEMRRLPRMVAETEVGRMVKVTVWRNRKQVTVGVKLGELEKFEQREATAEEDNVAPSGAGGGAGTAVDTLGLKLAELTADLRASYQIPKETKGVLITDVSPNGSAAERGLRPGDIVTEAGHQAVKTPAEVIARIKALREQSEKSMLVLVERRGADPRFFALRIDKDK